MENKLIDYIENSKLYSLFKTEIITSLNNSQDNVIIHLDDCLHFLDQREFKVWGLSPEEDAKLENYLLKYLSEEIPDFPFEIITEDYVVLYEPNEVYNFNENELPQKYKLPKLKLYYCDISYLTEDCGTQHYSTNNFEIETWEGIISKFTIGDIDSIIEHFDLFFKFNNCNHGEEKKELLRKIHSKEIKATMIKNVMNKTQPQDYPNLISES